MVLQLHADLHWQVWQLQLKEAVPLRRASVERQLELHWPGEGMATGVHRPQPQQGEASGDFLSQEGACAGTNSSSTAEA